MKRPQKILLGLATIWPVVYMVLFVLAVSSFIFFNPVEEEQASELRAQIRINIVQLEEDIKNNKIKRLTIEGNRIWAVEHEGEREWFLEVTTERDKDEILKQARALDVNGKPRVAQIEEIRPGGAPALFPRGFAGLFAAHLFTMLLVFGLMAFYIVRVVKSDLLDQTMKIIWTILICLMGVFAMPVFWYLYIWRDRPATSEG